MSALRSASALCAAVRQPLRVAGARAASSTPSHAPPRSGLRGQDAWRAHPIFQWRVLDALPGLREGAVLFVLVVLGEAAYDKATGGGEHH